MTTRTDVVKEGLRLLHQHAAEADVTAEQPVDRTCLLTLRALSACPQAASVVRCSGGG